MRPPSAFTSARTTSMPMPRPASSVTVSAVEKPGVKIRLRQLRRRCGSLPGAIRPVRVALVADAREVRGRRRRRGTRPTTSLPSWRERDDDGAGRVLAGGRARVAASSMPCATQLRSRCSKAPRHAVQHAAVDLDRAADDVQAHLLAGFLGGLAHHAVEAVGQALELDHARAQQVVAAARASGAPARPARPRSPRSVRCRVRCTVATSLTDSAIMRVSSWKRVKRSNSSGSKLCRRGLGRPRGATASAFRPAARCRAAGRAGAPGCSVRSVSEPLASGRRSVSMRERVMHDLAGLVHQAVEQRRAHAHRRLRRQRRARPA